MFLFAFWLCKDLKTDRERSGESEVCVKKETQELNISNHDDKLGTPPEALPIKEEDLDSKDNLCKTSDYSRAVVSIFLILNKDVD